MKYMQHIRLLSLFIFCSLFCLPVSQAQLVKGSISGTVGDSTGAAIVGATVTATEVNTNYVLTTKSNGTGFYVFPILSPGEYSIRVSASGFQTTNQNKIELHTGSTIAINFNLKVGTQQEEVTVAATTQQLLDADSPTLSQTLDMNSVNELPVVGRNVMALAVYMPGVVTTSAGTQIGAVGNRNYLDNGYAIDGSRTSSNEVLLDGVPNTIADFNGVGVNPPMGSISEYTLISGVPSAQYGRTSGGAVNITTRGGGNKYHGEAYGFLQNSVFNANTWANNHNKVGRTSSDAIQFGGNFTGPVLIPHFYNGHDKTFFFADYEGHRERNPVSGLITVPTDPMRRGDFSALPYVIYDPLTTACTTTACTAYTRTAFTGNIIPQARFDQVSSNLLKYWPEPTYPTQYVSNYYYAKNKPEHKNLYDIRIDQNLSQQHTFFGRYIAESHLDTDPDYLTTRASNAHITKDSFHNIVLGDDYTFKSIINDFRFGVTRAHAQLTPISDGMSPTDLGFPSSIAAYAPELEFPTIGISGHLAQTALGGQGFNNQPRETWSIADGLIAVRGNHQIRIGTDLRLYRFFAYQTTAPDGNFTFSDIYTRKNPLATDSTTGSGFASFLLGAMIPGSYIEYSTRLTIFHHYYAFYVNDTWKVTPKLTVNAGLRWEHETGTEENKDRLTYFDPNMDSPLNGKVAGLTLKGALQFTGDGHPRTILDMPFTAFQPRVGLVYGLNDKTVFRLGYGILALPISLETTSAQGFNTTNTVPQSSSVFVSTYLSNPFPSGLTAPQGKSQGASTALGQGITAVLRDVAYPYNQIWTASIQRAIAQNWMVEVAYMGSHGIHLPMSLLSLSQLDDSYLASGSLLAKSVSNPFYGILPTGTLSGKTVTQGYLYQKYPQYSTTTWTRPNIGASWFESFQVKVNKRLSHGLSMQASYNWSKTLDLGGVGNGASYLDTTTIQNVNNLKDEKALSNQDVPNALLLTGVANLPFGHGGLIGSSWHGWKDLLAGGWQVTGGWRWQGGRPFPIAATNSNVGFFNPRERPNLVGNPHYDLSTSRKNVEKGLAWFNKDAFAQPASYTYGNMPRSMGNLRTDTFRNIDLSLHKNFPVYSHLTGQFRAEAFNLPNQVVFGTPDSTLANKTTTFGTITASANKPRTLQFALRFMY